MGHLERVRFVVESTFRLPNRAVIVGSFTVVKIDTFNTFERGEVLDGH